MTEESVHPKAAPGGWRNTGEVYFFFLSTPQLPPDGAYDPLEANSFYGSPEAGSFRGGSASVQVVRYTESPAGISMHASKTQKPSLTVVDCKQARMTS